MGGVTQRHQPHSVLFGKLNGPFGGVQRIDDADAYAPIQHLYRAERMHALRRCVHVDPAFRHVLDEPGNKPNAMGVDAVARAFGVKPRANTP